MAPLQTVFSTINLISPLPKKNKLEKPYHKADASIQNIVNLLAA
jgi:hypothetical protein